MAKGLDTLRALALLMVLWLVLQAVASLAAEVWLPRAAAPRRVA